VGRDVADYVRADPPDGEILPLDAYASHLVAQQLLAEHDTRVMNALRLRLAAESRLALSLCRQCGVETP